ncbi:hypothetical protein PVAND_016117 [Polypedilum vanderplanki]|uniref:C2H2-type domain-containing protein n=1 Tax=Polypedilum vanderplanki TaxID=319348 RepID=A0A9J6BEX4_POLVA|nr:hypothetical protein PVAND_016117 [Polypedilum vanderplanki]
MEIIKETIVIQDPITDMICNLCCKKFVSFKNFTKHCNRCRNEQKIRFRCHTCNKGFRKKRGFDTHECSNCPYCFKFLNSIGSLNEHIKACHMGEKSEKLYLCDLCDTKFTFKTTLARHIMLLHYHSDKHYICNYCQKSFKNNLAMEMHKKRHTNFIKCEICNENINSKSFYHHKKEMHNVDRTYDCSECSSIFTTKNRLKYHKQTQKCKRENEFCSLFKYMKKNLEAIPINERFVCKHCNKKHESLLNLKIHLLFVHNETLLKVIKCDKCDYTTYIKGHMKDHQKAHANNWFIF